MTLQPQLKVSHGNFSVSGALSNPGTLTWYKINLQNDVADCKSL